MTVVNTTVCYVKAVKRANPKTSYHKEKQFFSLSLSFFFLVSLQDDGLPQWLSGKESACNAGAQEAQVQPLGGEDALEEGMAAHSSTLAWRIPRTEEPGGLKFIGLQSQI